MLYNVTAKLQLIMFFPSLPFGEKNTKQIKRLYSIHFLRTLFAVSMKCCFLSLNSKLTRNLFNQANFEIHFVVDGSH